MEHNHTFPPPTEAEQQRLLVEWNKTQCEYPRDESVQQRFEAQAELTPGATAVIFKDQSFTYQELNHRANQLARHLQVMGVGPETLVGICVERSPEMMVGLLGILKAGGAYVPLDPTYPRERLAFMLNHAQVSILLTQSRLLAQLPQLRAIPGMTLLPPSNSPLWWEDNEASPPLGGIEGGLFAKTGIAPQRQARLVCLDTDWPAIAKNDTANLPPTGSADNLAYVIYTSGSTGQPKGIQISHRALTNFLHSMRRQPGLSAQDVLLAVTTLSFDIAALELFLPLTTGAKLVIAGHDVTIDGAQLLQTLVEVKATIMQATPATWRLLLISGWQQDTGHLKILCGGEALSPNLARQLLTKSGQLWNMFGPTETTIWSTVCHLKQADSPISIGRPIANTQIYILDEQLEPVPIGAPGTLYIGGDGLARGYLHRPDLTAERFIPHPFSAVPGQRLYNTGDLARYLPDGNIEFLGRLDHQVKIRGFRIELGEIESALMQHPAVRETVVVGRQDNDDDETYLAAYLVPTAGSAPDVGNLRRFLRQTLPDYMIPSAFVRLDNLPLTPNGKVDRNALPDPRHARIRPEKEFTAPQTPLEQMLAGMWQDVLGLEPIGLHDDFFELGGDSIKGAIFVNNIQAQLKEIVHVMALFDAPTVAQLAAYFNEHYPKAVAKLLGRELDSPPPQPSQQRITAAQVNQLRDVIPSPAHRQPDDTASKNPPAIFILSPPRSGSTLLRVMLAGHNQLFAPPELELLPFNSLRERKSALSGRNSYLLEGAIRAIMQINSSRVDQAQQTMRELEERNLSTQQFYGLMQQWLGDKTLVEKSTSYAFNLDILKRAETYFENPLYIHLLRHPYGMINSFEKARLDQIFFRYDHPFSRRQLAELLWLLSHQNILEFLAHVPAQRCYQLKFEAMVYQPEAHMRQLCQFLNIDFQPDMVRPYKDQQQRMTDGLHAVSRMIGDFKFHEHSAINPAVADSWRQAYSRDFLGDVTWQLAGQWGYTPIEPANTPHDDELMARLDNLSDEEVDSLLADLLADGEDDAS